MIHFSVNKSLETINFRFNCMANRALSTVSCRRLMMMRTEHKRGFQGGVNCLVPCGIKLCPTFWIRGTEQTEKANQNNNRKPANKYHTTQSGVFSSMCVRKGLNHGWTWKARFVYPGPCILLFWAWNGLMARITPAHTRGGPLGEESWWDLAHVLK